MKKHKNYLYKEFKLGIFKMSIYWLGNKFSLRLEMSWGWDN